MPLKSSKFHDARRIGIPTILAVATAQAFAQSSPQESTPGASPEAIQTIVITARRINERMIDVPLSIQALTGRELEERGINNVEELSRITPGLNYSSDFGRAGERPVVRGISTNIPASPQPVSIFIDGLYIRDGALSLMLDDAQRVEVIKGPQSALYGRATYMGAINYVTKKPGKTFNGTVSLGVAEGGERTASGAMTIPLAESLSIRLRAKHYEYDGQFKNSLTGRKIGDMENDTMGISISFKPTSNFDALLTHDHAENRDGHFPIVTRPVPTQSPPGTVISQNGSSNVPNGATCNGHTVNITTVPGATATAAAKANGWPCGSVSFSSHSMPRVDGPLLNYTDPASGTAYGNILGLDREIDRTGLTMNYQFGGGYTLTSQTGVTRQQLNNGVDQSYNGIGNGTGIGAGTSWLTYARDHVDYKSQEIRLASPEDKPLTWLVGAFYYNEELNGKSSTVTTASGARVPLLPTAGVEIRNVAPFGRVQYDFGPSLPLRVSLEGRQNKETVKIIGTNLGVATVTTGACRTGQVCSLSGEKTFKDFSPRLTVDYKLAKNTTVYGQIARGSKSGGFNNNAGLSSGDFSYDGEKVKAYEIGYKTLMADDRIGINAAIFHNDIEELQLSNAATIVNPITGTSTSTTIVNNVGKARTRGLELDVSARVLEWLTLSGNYAYTDAKATKGTENMNGHVFGGDTSVAGFYLPRTPKHAATVSAAVDLPIAGTALRGFGRLDVTHQSRRYGDIQNMLWADPFTNVNVTLGVRAKTWRAALWVKNATDNDKSMTTFRYLDPATFRRTAADMPARPRQVGMTVTYDF